MKNSILIFGMVLVGPALALGQAFVADEDCASLGLSGDTPHHCFEASTTIRDASNVQQSLQKGAGIGSFASSETFDGLNIFPGAAFPSGVNAATRFRATSTHSSPPGQSSSGFSATLGLEAQLGDNNQPGNTTMRIGADSFYRVEISGPANGFSVNVALETEGVFRTPTVSNTGESSVFMNTEIFNVNAPGTPLFNAGGFAFVNASGQFSASGPSYSQTDFNPVSANEFRFTNTAVGSITSPSALLALGMTVDANVSVFTDGFESGDTTRWSTEFGDTFTLVLSSNDPGVSFTLVPEPQTYALVVGLGCLAFARLRNRSGRVA